MATAENSSTPESGQDAKKYPVWLIALTWVIAFLMIALMGFSLFLYFTGRSIFTYFKPSTAEVEVSQISELPSFEPTQELESVARSTNPDTVLPEGIRDGVVEYTIEQGDSLFGIAEEYEVEPESIMFANYNTLRDDPHLISVGVSLKIPPVDGLLYEWKEGDTLEKVAAEYNATVEDILLFIGNDLDMTNPVIEPGTFIMIPNGWRLLQPWVVAVSAGNDSGVTAQIAGPGSCTPSGGLSGTYSFIWPASYPGVVSGNDYWSGHQAIDAQCFEGEGILASDSGVVIYAGPISGGYGNLVAIDHQNGYLSLYAHLSTWYVGCGDSVLQGQAIGACGSTGNSTGAHLHFEVRQNGGFVNPWHVLQY